MRAERVLVTGGAGMIGSTIVDQLLDRDIDQIVVIDNLVRGQRANLTHALGSGRVRLVDGDICDPAVLRKAMAGVETPRDRSRLRTSRVSGPWINSHARRRPGITSGLSCLLNTVRLAATT